MKRSPGPENARKGTSREQVHTAEASQGRKSVFGQRTDFLLQVLGLDHSESQALSESTDCESALLIWDHGHEATQ